jgi:glycoside/pentoside/hexuronide:cation symporter, GPH family
LESREAEENARIHEENRIADLKEHCAKKGLDFDVENAKYLAKQAKKQKVKK